MWNMAGGRRDNHLKENNTIQLTCVCRDVALILPLLIFHLKDVQSFLCCLLAFKYCSVAKLCLTLCDCMDCSIPYPSVVHYLNIV